MLFRTVYIGIGSNLGDREEEIQAGIRAIEIELVERKSIKSLTTSPIYETEAWGMPPETPLFLNQVIALETDMDVELLLKVLLKIETDLGRTRQGDGYSNRTIDLDILLDRDLILKTKELIIPHPKIVARRFVLQPLSDLDSEMIIPGYNCTVGEALKICPKKPEVRIWAHTHT
jgi:2-amino-4-hydroxy-6-hydroxymethyldihydropteridine diphosphokinase